MKLHKIAALAAALIAATAQAEKYELPPPDVTVIGQIQQISARKGETFAEIGREYGIGYDAMEHANQGLDGLYLQEGDQLLLPTRFILPDAPREGIVINLPEMRLYYYPPGQNVVHVFAIGIGREGWATPKGILSIADKRANPTWTPPASIRAEHAANGDPLPAVVPAGPDNPLGLFAMRLSNPSYLLHGTNKPEGVGMRVSHGCIRLYPEGIEELFGMVAPGTKVNIINQPMKVGWFGDSMYLEFHAPLGEDARTLEQNIAEARETVHKSIASRGLQVSNDLIDAVVREETGLPVEVAYR